MEESNIYRYFIYLAYNGKNYCGWQVQPNGNTVQAELEKALATIRRVPTPITGAGRTDTGVHAALMVAHFDSETVIENEPFFAEKLNRVLPFDIAVSAVRRVTPDAHARFDATSRTYKYYITEVKDVFRKDLSYKVHGTLDFERMNEAAKVLFDYIDFTSFSKLHTDVKTNNCKMMQAHWQLENGQWVFTIQADRFLRNMVRAVVGTLLEVGRGRMTIDQFRQVIEAKDRGKAGASVPPQALFLVEIDYPSELFI